MRTTVELSDSIRARLLDLAARRGERGFSAVVEEAVARYLEEEERREERGLRARAVIGAMDEDDGRALEASVRMLRDGGDDRRGYGRPHALRGRKPAAERIALELETGALATTVVTAFELRSGARSALALEQVNELLGALVMLPLDERAATRAAEVRRVSELRVLRSVWPTT